MNSFKVILKFDRDIFQGLTPMVFVSTASHIIFLLLIMVVSSRISQTISMPEPVFTVSLSSFSLPTSGTSGSLKTGETDTEQAEVLKEVKTPTKPPAPPKKETITLPDEASKKVPKEKKEKVPTTDRIVPKQAVSPPPEGAGSQGPLSIPTGTGEGGSGGISAAGMENFEYAWYRAMVISKLKEHWIKPVLPFTTAEPLQVIVYFVIEREGSVSHVSIDASSGYPPLDRSAVRAIYDSIPLPPLPRQIAHSHLPARFIFELKQE